MIAGCHSCIYATCSCQMQTRTLGSHCHCHYMHMHEHIMCAGKWCGILISKMLLYHMSSSLDCLHTVLNYLNSCNAVLTSSMAVHPIASITGAQPVTLQLTVAPQPICTAFHSVSEYKCMISSCDMLQDLLLSSLFAIADHCQSKPCLTCANHITVTTCSCTTHVMWPMFVLCEKAIYVFEQVLVVAALNKSLNYLKHYRACLISSMTLLTTASLRDEFIPLTYSCIASIWAAFALVTECILMINSCDVVKYNFS